MKIQVRLQQEKMSERQVREKLEKAAATARQLEQQKGGSDRGQDSMRRLMEQNAERDKKDGKI